MLVFRKSLLIFAVFFLSSVNKAQNDSWKVFDDTQMSRIEITVSPAALTYMYQNVNSDSEHVAKVHFVNNHINETHDSVGFRLRGATSRNAKKKSFKVEFNSFVKGRKFYDITDLNLNGEHNDPSIVRSKIVYDLARTIGLKAPRAAHVEVYVNNKYYGLYILTEQMDDEWLKKNYQDFSGNLWKCVYPADLKYLGMDPNLYKNVMNNSTTPAYDLKTNTAAGDFSKFVRLVNLINNTPSAILADSIESVVSIQDLLKYYALHVLVGGWDNYWSLMNNYYLYHNPSEDLFHMIPYDEDNTFGIDWFNVNWGTANIYSWPKVASGSRPLADKIMANNQYRNLYTHFLDHIAKNAFYLSNWEKKLDSLKALINVSAVADSFRTLDYGFTITHFHNSYSASFSNQHVKYGMKQFAITRYNSYPGMIQWLTCPPIVYNISTVPANPGPNDSIRIYVSAFDNDGITKASVMFTKTGSSTGVEYPLIAAPVAGTKKVEEADRYTTVIPPLGANGSGTFTVYVKDSQNSTQIYPRKRPAVIKVNAATGNSVVVNELLADNSGLVPDPAGEFDDYVELYNPTPQAILLTGKYLTDNASQLKKWRFTQPQLFIQPNSYLMVWCDEQPTQQGVHAGFKLSKSGEYVALVDTNGTTILDSVTFGSQATNIAYGRVPDGSANWQLCTPTPNQSNLTGIEDAPLGMSSSLLSAYPNPFNPSTTIALQLASENTLSITVYDVLGREVKHLYQGKLNAGLHNISFNAGNLPSGTYIVVARGNELLLTQKLMYLK